MRMKSIYSPREFGLLVGRTTKTLQRWDREGTLQSARSITERRYYTHDQYLQIIGKKAKNRRLVTYCQSTIAGQKKDLISQKNAVESFCLAAGKIIHCFSSRLYGLRKYKKTII